MIAGVIMSSLTDPEGSFRLGICKRSWVDVLLRQIVLSIRLSNSGSDDSGS